MIVEGIETDATNLYTPDDDDERLFAGSEASGADGRRIPLDWIDGGAVEYSPQRVIVVSRKESTEIFTRLTVGEVSP